MIPSKFSCSMFSVEMGLVDGLVDGLVCMGRGGVGGGGGGGLVFVFGMMAGGAWCGVGGVCVEI